VGPITYAKLIAGFGTPDAALAAPAEDIQKRCGLNERVASSIADFAAPSDDLDKEIETLSRLQVHLLTRWTDGYPPNLESIYDPPALLFVRGSILNEDCRAVAVVGTRAPTRYGMDVTESITRDLVKAGITIVSGLARGIDTAAHRAALKAGGRTIGVLGCGIDVVYPRENRSLMEEIAESGAVITEFRVGIQPLATNFYRRNRIVSGLSHGVLVVEAAKNSGSLITAGHAADQNRDVFAVPGNVTNLRTRGPHKLLREGAGLVETAGDIVDCLFGGSTLAHQRELFGPHAQQAEPAEVRVPPEDLSEDALRVLQCLDAEVTPIDVLCETLGVEPGWLSGTLLDLELRGLVRQFPGKMFARAPK
jgi:DNA processing protein